MGVLYLICWRRNYPQDRGTRPDACGDTFSSTKNTSIAHLKTPISVIVHVLSALTEGMGINAVTRLYGVSKNSIYSWQERLSGLKKRSSCLP
jgi:transposase-like protein